MKRNTKSDIHYRAMSIFCVVALLCVLGGIGLSLRAEAASSYTLQGKWRFNSTLSYLDANGDGSIGPYDRTTYELSFSSNSENYYSFSYDNDGGGPWIAYRYGGTIGGVVPYRDGAWSDDAYRYVDFGTTAVPVSSNFYDWFVDNAKPVNATVKYVGNYPDGRNPLLSIQTLQVGTTYGTNGFPSDPTYSGYSFKGWYTAASGGTKVTVNSDVPEEDHTLYAQWSVNKYSITLDKQAGSGGPDYIYETYNSGFMLNGSSITSLYAVPSRTGYLFGGYYTGKDGSGTQVIDATGKIMVEPTYFTSDTTVYAYWKSNATYKLTVNPNGGSWKGSSNSTIYTGQLYEDISITEVPIREGYTFTGWKFSGSGRWDEATGRYTFQGGNSTLTAQWTASSKFTIYFDLNGGSWEGGTSWTGSPGDYADDFRYMNDPTRNGYTFAGWVHTGGGEWDAENGC